MQHSHRLFAVKVFSHERHRECVRLRPQELFEIKRVNLERVLFRRNQDVFASFCNTGKRSGFQVVVASVFQKRFESLPSLWEKLNFVQNYQRLSTIQLRLVLELKLCEKNIQIAQTVDKQILENLVCLIKTNQDVALRPNFSASVVLPTRSAPLKNKA